jgi:hypothetical protein
MKRGLAAGAVIVSLIAGGILQAHASGSNARVTSLKLRAKTATAKLVNNDPTGTVGAGDQLLQTEDVTKGGRTVGHSVVACTIVTDTFESQCSFTLTLRNGSLQYAGRGTQNRIERFAVVGGTGAYAQARGEVVTTERGPAEHDLAFKLVR